MNINFDRVQFVKRTICVVVSGALSGGITTAYAADTGALEEIIITAQKRKENLQQVPISVLSMDAATLEKRNVVSLSDINDGSVPGVSLAPYPGSSEIFWPYFRGIATNSVFISAPSPIAVHLNGVFLSQLAGLNNPAADLERIEVLKGPQGVLSGRNATGGAINIYTAKPELDEFGFKQQFTVAQRGQFVSKTVANIPMSDRLAVKLAYVNSSRDNDGVTNSAPGGAKFGQNNSDAWRVDLRWKPIDTVTVDYGYDYALSKGYDTPPQCLYARASYVGLGYIDARAAAFVNACTPEKQTSLYSPFITQKNRNLVEGHTLNIEWVASSTLTVRSITGYRKLDTSNNYNYGAYPGAADARSDSGSMVVTSAVPGVAGMTLGYPIRLYNDAYSQEFQFLGDLSKSLKYTAGVYYSSEKGRQSSGPNVGMYMPSGTGTQGVDLLMIDAKGLLSARSDSTAIFGQVNWSPDAFDGKLEVVPGVRFTKDHRQAVGYNTGWALGYAVVPTGPGTVMLVAPPFPIAAPNIGFSSAAGDLQFSKSTPALSFNYHWKDELMTYLKFAKGYTSGGFDPVSGGAAAADFTKGFAPETINSVELGLKGEFLSHRLRTNAALFQSKFTNEQKSIALPGGGWHVANVGGSTYDGLEMDLTAAVTDNLRLALSLAHLSHKYTSWIDPTLGDVTNLRRLDVPKNDYTVSMDYRFPTLGLPGRLDGTLSYSHRDALGTPLNLTVPNVVLYSTTPAFSLWNARLALSRIKVGPGERGDLTVALWGKNLTDKKYLTLANQGWTSDGSGNWGEPRTVGIDVIYRY